MNTLVRKTLVAGGLLAACITGGAIGGSMLGVAGAQTDDSTTTTVPATATKAERAAREPRAELTGANATKALAAAKSEVSDATPLGVHSARDGGYVVGMRKADGTHVRVLLDSEFKVVDTREGKPHRHGPRGHGGPRPGAPAAASGTTAS